MEKLILVSDDTVYIKVTLRDKGSRKESLSETINPTVVVS